VPKVIRTGVGHSESGFAASVWLAVDGGALAMIVGIGWWRLEQRALK
jgi:hypothetical protein